MMTVEIFPDGMGIFVPPLVVTGNAIGNQKGAKPLL